MGKINYYKDLFDSRQNSVNFRLIRFDTLYLVIYSVISFSVHFLSNRNAFIYKIFSQFVNLLYKLKFKCYISNRD